MSIKSRLKKVFRLSKASPEAQDEPDDALHQTRYRDDAEVDVYDEHKLQKMADDLTGSPAGDGPDS